MSDNQKERKQLKKQLLDQIKAQQEAIEALSEEELDSIAGGFAMNMNPGGMGPRPGGMMGPHPGGMGSHPGGMGSHPEGMGPHSGDGMSHPFGPTR